MDSEDLPIATDSCMVIVFGETGSGKSYFIRKLTSNPQVRVSNNLESCTQSSEAFEARIGGTSLLLIDTPGFDDSVRSDSEVVLEIVSSLVAQSAIGVRLLGIVYLHDITVTRMRGSLKRELEMLRRIVGPRNYKHILLVTTKWGDASRRREFESRQYELEDNYWDDLISNGAGVYRFEGTQESARAIISQLNFGTSAVLAVQGELAQKNVEFRQTSIGRYTEHVQKERQKELDRLTTVGRSDTSSTRLSRVADSEVYGLTNSSMSSSNIAELEALQQQSAVDEQILHLRLGEEIKKCIREVVREEKAQYKQKPTVSRAMSGVLARITSLHNRKQGNRVGKVHRKWPMAASSTPNQYQQQLPYPQQTHYSQQSLYQPQPPPQQGISLQQQGPYRQEPQHENLRTTRSPEKPFNSPRNSAGRWPPNPYT